ncbi:hypothetical protein [Winogradskyella tangerina]|nr:hypothetical protein [Winogradskyella tangerina]
MAKKEKNKKERAKKYEEKLSIDGTLDDVLKISVPKPKEDKKDE